MHTITPLNVTGRLSSAPIIIQNTDGSRSVQISIRARSAQLNAFGEYDYTRMIFNDTIAAGTDDSIYTELHAEDLVTIEGHVETYTYTNDAGQTIYGQQVRINNITALESTWVRKEHAALDPGHKPQWITFGSMK